MNVMGLKELIREGGLDEKFRELYGDGSIEKQRERYIRACVGFENFFPEHHNVALFSAPGRTEICGNHTDHQHGCVLAAAVDLDIIGIVAFNDENVIRVQSEGHNMNVVNISDLAPQKSEEGTSDALIRGVAAGFRSRGLNIGGFDAYTTSDVLGGSGLSSSAAFEVLIGTIIDKHYNNGKAGAIEIAKMGQLAENAYFGKKSGLMDQTASSVGSSVFIDFENTSAPKVVSAKCDLDANGYVLFITDTKGSHADLSDEYSAIPSEMISVAKQLGKDWLRAADEDEFYSKLPELRRVCGDRSVLRAAHFFAENKRAQTAAEAIENNDMETFLKTIRESGDSSARLLQNLYACKTPQEQGIPVALMMSEKLLAGEGATRVHGGGFAGTIQAFVPKAAADKYRAGMDSLFGEGSCHQLRIRNCGGIELL